jgi:hypothetical protein
VFTYISVLGVIFVSVFVWGGLGVWSYRGGVGWNEACGYGRGQGCA